MAASPSRTLAKCDWGRKGEPLCLIGDSGTGKSHLLIGLGTAADDKVLAKTISRYSRVDLICVDELAYMD